MDMSSFCDSDFCAAVAATEKSLEELSVAESDSGSYRNANSDRCIETECSNSDTHNCRLSANLSDMFLQCRWINT